MKKLILMTFILTMGLSATIASTVQNKINTESVKNQNQVYNEQVLISRLKEIKELTRHELTAIQKKDLRSEVLRIDAQLHGPYGGVYISAGALILILILLIILL